MYSIGATILSYGDYRIHIQVWLQRVIVGTYLVCLINLVAME